MPWQNQQLLHHTIKTTQAKELFQYLVRGVDELIGLFLERCQRTCTVEKEIDDLKTCPQTCSDTAIYYSPTQRVPARWAAP